MTIRSLLPITYLLFSSCVTQDYRPGALDSLKQLHEERAPAAESNLSPLCFFDRFKNPDSSEIQNAEVNTLSIPEKIRGQRAKIYEYFRARVDGYVHSKFASFLTQCTDVMCFYEKVYGNALSGKLAYLVFLKTGMAVAASDRVPGVTSLASESANRIADFLFTDTELRMMIESAEAITRPRFSLFSRPELLTVHKVPIDTLTRAESRSVRNSCGFADGTRIVLSGDCMQGNWQAKLQRGDFSLRSYNEQGHDVFLHEFGHCVDFNFSQPRLSALPSWRSMSQTLRPSSDGVIYYSHDNIPAGFVTGYAATSYAEDFAETFSHYRLRPRRTQTTVPAKYEYLTKNLFAGQQYTSDLLNQQLVETVQAEILEKLESIVKACIGQTDTSKKPSLYQSSNLPIAELACVEKSIVATTTLRVREFQRNFPEGCTQSEANWVIAALTPNKDLISKSIASAETTRKVGLVRKKLDATLDPKEVFLEFRKSTQANQLFTKVLIDHFEKYRAEFNGIDSTWGNTEFKSYLSRNEFNVVREAVHGLVFEKLKETSLQRTGLVDSALQKCLQSGRALVAEPESLLKKSFVPGLNPEMIRCGSAALNAQARNVVLATFKSQASPASQRLLDFADELTQSDLTDLYRRRVLEEVEKNLKVLMQAAQARLGATDQKAIPLERILNESVFERESICRGVVRKILFDDVFKTSASAPMMTYQQGLIDLENSYCEAKIDQNSKHVFEIENFRNQTARLIYTAAFRRWPGEFPQDTTTFKSANSPVEVVSPQFQASCNDELGKLILVDPRVAALLANPFQASFVNSGVKEVCLNGRYAGRFKWLPMSRFIEYGGIRALGIAEFYMDPPMGIENRAYLYSLKRYIQFRTSEKLQLKHQN